MINPESDNRSRSLSIAAQREMEEWFEQRKLEGVEFTSGKKDDGFRSGQGGTQLESLYARSAQSQKQNIRGY